jgi:ParB/RepB/Spo0J family partition protein
MKSVTSPAAGGRLRRVPLASLIESLTNPRTRFNQAAMAELTESVRAKGVLQPLLVRPHAPIAEAPSVQFEIVDGACRYRAAVAADLVEVDVIVQDMSDAEMREVQLITGLQRSDLHPLDEAEGFRALMDLDPSYTPEAVAAKVGKSKKYVYDRLKFAALIPEAKDAFATDQITAGHAILIARLQPGDQERALEAAFHTLWDAGDAGDDDEDGGDQDAPAVARPKVAISVRELDRWIEQHCRLDIRASEVQETLPALAEVMRQADAGGGEVLDVCAEMARCKKHFPPKPKGPDYKKARADDAARWKKDLETRQRNAKIWNRVRKEALKAVVAKARGLKITNKLLEAVLVERSRHPAKDIIALMGPVTLATFAQGLAVADALSQAYTMEGFASVAKQHGVDLKKLEAQMAPPAAADTPKKTGKVKAAKAPAASKPATPWNGRSVRPSASQRSCRRP